jgi:DNA-binding transcriptional ArsR family regulator
MVNLLLPGPLCVKHFQAILGLSQVTASKQLGYLKRRGLLEVRRHGTLRVHSLPVQRDPVLAAHLRCLGDCAAGDATCQRDLARRKGMESDIHRAVTTAPTVVLPRRPTVRSPDALPTPAGAWPSVDDGPLLD